MHQIFQMPEKKSNKSKKNGDFSKFIKPSKKQTRNRVMLTDKKEDANYIKKTKKKTPILPHTPRPEFIRLNRYIANAGVCSRRDADELIVACEIKRH